MSALEEYRRATRFHSSEGTSCKTLADAAIAELEAENRLVKDDFDRMQRECKHEKIRADKAEAHAADCKRLVTACENDIDAERMKRREAEAALAAARDEFCTDCEWLPKSMRARTEEGSET